MALARTQRPCTTSRHYPKLDLKISSRVGVRSPLASSLLSLSLMLCMAVAYPMGVVVESLS